MDSNHQKYHVLQWKLETVLITVPITLSYDPFLAGEFVKQHLRRMRGGKMSKHSVVRGKGGYGEGYYLQFSLQHHANEQRNDTRELEIIFSFLSTFFLEVQHLLMNQIDNNLKFFFIDLLQNNVVGLNRLVSVNSCCWVVKAWMKWMNDKSQIFLSPNETKR